MRTRSTEPHSPRSPAPPRRPLQDSAFSRPWASSAWGTATASAASWSSLARWSLADVPAHPPGRGPQARLAIGSREDPLEHAADRAAEAVLGASSSTVSPRGTPGRNPSVLRLQHASASTSRPMGGAPPIVSDVLRSGGGHPLDAGTRAFFEPRFGHDFSRVRVHTGARASDSTRAIGALAYTSGPDIVFRSGHYAPATSSGLRLLAHELAHVTQQASSGGAPGVIRRGGVGEWWEKNVSKSYAGLKDKAYRGLIDGVRSAQRRAFSTLRASASTLPASLQGPAGVLISIVEETLGVVMAAVYAILGIVVGLSEGVFEIVKGLIQFLYAVMELLVSFVAGFFMEKGRRVFHARASEIIAAVKNLPAGLKALIAAWYDRFEKAPTELQSVMIGELTGKLLVFIGTLPTAVTTAGQIPKLTLPVLVGKGDQLALAVATVSVGAPAVAGVMVGTAAMMTTGGGSRSSQSQPTEAERLEELSKDPDHGGKVTPTSQREAQVALDLEKQGRLKAPVRRPAPGDGHTGDIVDGAGTDWDIKRPRSRGPLEADIQQEAIAKGRKPPQFNPKKRITGQYDLNTTLAEIRGELAAGENVIIDTSKLDAVDLAQLTQALKNEGLLGNRVILYP